jgi:methyl-accepting chemotaxis protein
MKLGPKLLMGGLLATILPIFLLGVIVNYRSSQSLHAIAEQNLLNTSSNIANNIASNLANELRMNQTIAATGSVLKAIDKVTASGASNSKAEIDIVQQELENINSLAGEKYSSILLVTRDSIVFADSGKGKFNGLNLQGRAYLEKAFRGEANIGSVVFSRATGKVVLTVASPVYSRQNGEISGAVICAISIDYITDIVNLTKIGKDGYSYVIANSGIYIIHPDAKRILKADISNISGMEGLASMLKGGESGITEYTRDDLVQSTS